MMPCPDLGALRASIDDVPGATPTPLHDHVRACPSCSDTLAELQRNADLAAPAIALTAPDEPPTADAVEAALARVEQRRARLAAARTAMVPATATLDARPTAAPTPATLDARAATAPTPATAVGRAASVPGDARAGAAPDPVPSTRRGWGVRMGTRARAVAAALAAAVVLAGVLVTPGGRAAAAGFLAQFRSQRFQVVPLDAGQSTQVDDVMAGLVESGVFTGDPLEVAGLGEPEVVADLAEAGRQAGFAVPAVDPSTLPAGVGPAPRRILVSPAREVRITFDRDRALEYLRRHGRSGAQLPERFDGTQLVVQVPAVVVQQFSGRDGAPALLVGKGGMLGLDTEGGASLEELREVVLDLPGLPSETVARLRAIDDWRTTLPLPVPADQVRWRSATVGGAEAVSFTDPSGRLRALLWQRDGHIWAVAGVVGSDEARDVAEALG
jgi:hypothetical protein